MCAERDFLLVAGADSLVSGFRLSHVRLEPSMPS